MSVVTTKLKKSWPVVLLIEDKAEWLRVLRRNCEKEEYATRSADTLEKAVALLKRVDFDAIVADLRLVDWQKGNIQGLEALASVPEEKRPPAIIVTAYPDPDHVRLAFRDYKVIDVLYKSNFDNRLFLKKLGLAIRESKKRRADRASARRIDG